MIRVLSPSASARLAAAMKPSKEPPLDRSTNGYMPLKKRSPMWTTPARRKCTIASPSVCAGGTWKASTSSPLRWRGTASVNVTTGSARAREHPDPFRHLLRLDLDLLEVGSLRGGGRREGHGGEQQGGGERRAGTHVIPPRQCSNKRS